MRLNAKELIADARVTAPTLPPAAAKLMTEMANRLDVQFAALRESREQVKQLAAQLKLYEAAERAWETTMMQVCGEDGPLSVAVNFNQLASERDAVVAENVTLKGVVKVVYPNLNIDVSTETVLASLRAEGVEMFAEQQRSHIGMPNKNDAASSYSSREAIKFAAQLRSQSAPSPEAAAIARQSERVKGVQS